MQGTNTDYEDKETDAANVRSYPGGAGDPMAYAPTGHLWDQAINQGVSVENFGEDTTDFTGTAPCGNWTDWYSDSLILSGQKQGELHVPIGNYEAKYDIPSLGQLHISRSQHLIWVFQTNIGLKFSSSSFNNM